RSRHWAAQYFQLAPKLALQIRNHPVVGGRSCSKERNTPRKTLENSCDAPVIRPKVMAPVRDAMGLIDNEESNLMRDGQQSLFHEGAVAQPFGRNEQQIHLASVKSSFDRLPFGLVGALGSDSLGAQPYPAGRKHLVAHQRKQRGDQERRT